MLLLDVTKDFAICVKELTTNEKHGFLARFEHVGISVEEARRLSQDHWARPTFLNNLCGQIGAYEQKFKGQVTKEGRKKIIAAGSQVFLNAIIEHKRQEMLTAIQKSQITNRDNLQKEVASLIKEVPPLENRN